MVVAEKNAINMVAEELYQVNHHTYIQDLSKHIEGSIKSWMHQVQTGQVMDKITFNDKIWNIPLK